MKARHKTYHGSSEFEKSPVLTGRILESLLQVGLPCQRTAMKRERRTYEPKSISFLLSGVTERI